MCSRRAALTDYQPAGYVVGVYKRGEFPNYLPLLETIWQQHIDGKIGLNQLTSKTSDQK